MIIKPEHLKRKLEELKFSMPENARFSGRLLIIGGSSSGFSQASQALSLAIKNGAGNSFLALPDNLKRLLPKYLSPAITLLPSEKIGSFNSESYTDLLNLSLNSGTVLISGELGRGSQTAQTILSLVKQLSLPVIISGDANLFLQNEDFYLSRENIFLFLNLAIAQRLFKKKVLIKLSDDPLVIESKLAELAEVAKLNLCFYYQNWLYALLAGQVYRIKLKSEPTDLLMPGMAARFAAIKTWSKAADWLNLSLALEGSEGIALN